MNIKRNRLFPMLLPLLIFSLSLTGCGKRDVDVAATPPVSQTAPSASETSGETASSGGSHILTIPLPGAGETVSESASGETSESSVPGPSEGEGTTAESPNCESPSGGSGSPGVKAIALTFDDGPDTGNSKATTKILDTLEANGAKATFFVVGQALKEWFPDTGKAALQRAVEMGCEIGTHTYSHKNLNKSDSQVIAEEVSKGCQVIEEATGQEVTLMRPPYGNAKDSVVEQVDLPLIQWDVDPEDWKDGQTPEAVVDNIMQNVKPGSIVLMHDTYGSTAKAVEMVVPKLLEEGYQLVTVSELFELYERPLEPHVQYYNARGSQR